MKAGSNRARARCSVFRCTDTPCTVSAPHETEEWGRADAQSESDREGFDNIELPPVPQELTRSHSWWVEIPTET